jgi:hypothetical protein
LFRKLAGATFADPKEAGKKTKCNDKQLLCSTTNQVFDTRQGMKNKQQVMTNNKHYKIIK